MEKLKAITFSYDDGVEQDKRLIEIFDRYGLKCTFNLNSGMLGEKTTFERTVFGIRKMLDHHLIPENEIKQVYKNHEVAGHTLRHPLLHEISDSEVIRQVREDAINLERITGKKVNGLAYPGSFNEACKERIPKLIRENTDLYYGRTTRSTYSFDLQENLLEFNPTVSHREKDERMIMAKKLFECETDKPQIFYIWGHSYELDVDEKEWYDFEKFCEFIAGRNDILYATNDEVFKFFDSQKQKILPILD